MTVKMSKREVTELDALRKGMSRSAYIRTLITQSSLSEPDPPDPVALDPEPFVPPVSTPITPTPITPAVSPTPVSPALPYPPPPAAATSRSPRHLHKYKTATEPSRYVQGRPVYPKVCECGAMKEGTR